MVAPHKTPLMRKTTSLQIAADSLKLQQASYAVGRSPVLALIWWKGGVAQTAP